MAPLYRSHRTFGRLVAKATTDDGQQLAILQTAAHKYEVSPAHMLQEVSRDELLFEARMALAAAIERARFLGIDGDALRALFDGEVKRS